MRISVLPLGVACVAMVAACAEPSKLGFSPENDLRVVNAQDTFDLAVDDLRNVFAELSYVWEVSAPRVRVFHCSFLPHGESRLVVVDAAGDTLYDRPLLYRLEGIAEADGVPGSWTVSVGFYGSVGAWADVVLQATTDTAVSGVVMDDLCTARGR